MADEIDRANDQAQMILDHSLQVRKPVGKVQPIGECHWCGNEFDEDSLKLFCDSVCATKHYMLHGS